MGAANKATHCGRRGVRLARALLGSLLAAGLLAGSATAYAAERDDAIDHLNSIAAEYDALTLEQNETLDDLQEVRDKISDTEGKIADVQDEVSARKEELATKRAVLADHVSSDYKAGGVSLLSILLSADSFEDAISKIHYFDVICKAEVAKIDDVNAAWDKLKQEQDALEKLKGDLQAQESSIEDLYAQQRERADAMHAQQLEAAELISTMSEEDQQKLGDDAKDLIAEAQTVIDAEQSAEAQPTSSAGSQGAAGTQKDAGSASSSSQGTSSKETEQKQQQQQQQQQQQEQQTPAAPTTSTSDGTLQRLLDVAATTGPERKEWGCSGWVYTVFKKAGISRFSGSAADFYNTWCYTSDRSQLKPGMIIAVSNTGGSAAGRMYGHICIYMGNNTVRHFFHSSVLENMSLDTWINTFGRVCTPRWGWNGGVPLS